MNKMISADLTLFFAALLFVVGGGMTIYHNRLTKFALTLGTIAGVLFGWVVTAASLQRPVIDVAYYPIVQRQMDDGTVMDAIVMSDEKGEPHYLNINKALGTSVPPDNQNYQVARVKYSGISLGLLFRERSIYKIVRK